LIQNRNHLLCLIVCDCMVYPDPKVLICKTEKWPNFFMRLEADCFLIPYYYSKLLQQIHWYKSFMMLTMTTSKLHISIQIVV
jgi:hypothetical protein